MTTKTTLNHTTTTTREQHATRRTIARLLRADAERYVRWNSEKGNPYLGTLEHTAMLRRETRALRVLRLLIETGRIADARRKVRTLEREFVRDALSPRVYAFLFDRA